MSRSQSFPFELSSLRKRSAKLVQGTNSSFIWVPVLAVKSLESSTKAFAGSQAAQHSVNCFDCACAAEGAKASITTANGALIRAIRFFMIRPPGFVFTELNSEKDQGAQREVVVVGAVAGLALGHGVGPLGHQRHVGRQAVVEAADDRRVALEQRGIDLAGSEAEQPPAVAHAPLHVGDLVSDLPAGAAPF